MMQVTETAYQRDESRVAMTETEQSIARTIADFEEYAHVLSHHQELARITYQDFIADLEDRVDYLREEVKYLSDPDS